MEENVDSRLTLDKNCSTLKNPLVVNYNVVGFMTCFLTKDDKINEYDIDFISSVSSLISLSIDITMKK